MIVIHVERNFVAITGCHNGSLSKESLPDTMTIISTEWERVRSVRGNKWLLRCIHRTAVLQGPVSLVVRSTLWSFRFVRQRTIEPVKRAFPSWRALLRKYKRRISTDSYTPSKLPNWFKRNARSLRRSCRNFRRRTLQAWSRQRRNVRNCSRTTSSSCFSAAKSSTQMWVDMISRCCCVIIVESTY